MVAKYLMIFDDRTLLYADWYYQAKHSSLSVFIELFIHIHNSFYEFSLFIILFLYK